MPINSERLFLLNALYKILILIRLMFLSVLHVSKRVSTRDIYHSAATIVMARQQQLFHNVWQRISVIGNFE